MIMSKGYVLTDKNTPAGFNIIRVTEGVFTDVEYSYGGVTFGETDDTLTFKFDYFIHSGQKFTGKTEKEFGEVAGKILTQILQEQIESPEGPQVVYAGGV